MRHSETGRWWTITPKAIHSSLLLASITILLSVLASCSTSGSMSSATKIDKIKQKGTLLVGTTGDYRPLSYLDPQTQTYWGFDAELAEIIGNDLGVKVQFVPTSWPTLTEDMHNEKLFDLAMCGITITDARKETMLMSEGYLRNGKTILCRKADAARFTSIDSINQPGVRIMVNPGGTNEKFANANLTNAQITIHQKNEEIPSLIAQGKADIMITEIVEAPYYVQNDPRLAAPLLTQPFNHNQIGVLMRKGDTDLLNYINRIITTCKSNGTLKRLHEKYGFVYDFQ